MATFKGIDVSVHNGNIDWTKVSKQVDFAILRAGFGKVASQKDKRFDANYKGCMENNIPIGVYWYNYATTVADAKKEAEVCVSILRGKKVDYPVWYDIEERATLNTGKTNVSNIAKAFLEVVEKAGYKVGIYSMKSALDSSFTDAVKKKYDIWVAHVGKNGAALSSTSYKGHTMWQYSWTGKIDGINGAVDTNYCYKEYVSKKATETSNTKKEETKTSETKKEETKTSDSKKEETKIVSNGVDVFYNVYTKKWLGEVKNCNDKDINGYAGLDNNKIYGLTAKASKGILKYRVHLKNGRWLGWISKSDINDWNTGVAGSKNREIDGIQFDFSGVKDYKVKYRVSVIGNKGYLPWVEGCDKYGDVYAGVYGWTIDKLQVKIEK